VLQVKQRLGPLERGIVEPRQMPHEVRAEPERQRYERMREGPHDSTTAGVGRQRGGQPEHGERRRPFGQDDVLEQVRRDEVVARQRVQRRDERCNDQRHAGDEARDPPPRRAVDGYGCQIRGRQYRDEDDRFEIPGPCERVDAVTVSRGAR
jgi:hypothetical protein